MNETSARITALKALLSKEPSEESIQPPVEAAIALAEELVRAGDAKGALDLLELAQRHAEQVPTDTVFKIAVARVAALMVTGLHAEALETASRLTRDSQLLLARNPEVAGRLVVFEGSCLWMLNRAEDSVRVLSQLRERLLMQRDSALLAFCTTQLSAAHWLAGDSGSSAELALDALVSARRSGEKYFLGQALTNYCRIQRLACRWAEATQAAEESLRVHEELGARHQANHARRSMALIHWKRGRLEDALEASECCVDEAASLQALVHHSMALLIRALVLIHMGRFQEAVATCSEVPSWSVHHNESRAALLAAEYLGDIFLEQGDARSAECQFTELCTRALAVAPKSDIVAELRRRLAECYYLLGRHGEAYAEAKAGLEHCRELGDRYEEAATYRILALSAAAVGKPDEAKKWFDEACSGQSDHRARRSNRSPSRDCTVLRLRPRSRRGRPQPGSLPAAA